MDELFSHEQSLLYEQKDLFTLVQEKKLLVRNILENSIEKKSQGKNLIDINKEIELEIKIIVPNKSNSCSETSTYSNFCYEPKKQFKISKKITNESGKNFSGRKRKNPITEDSNGRIHNKSAKDNITRKIQVHAMNSIIQYLNEVVSQIDLGLDYIPVFKKIDYSFKRNIKSDTLKQNKNKSIENFIKNEVSPRYKKWTPDSNKKEYEKIKNNEIVKNILSQKYIDFLKDIFYKNERKIDLSNYGLKKIVYLSNKVKLYEDMFKGKIVDEKYRNRVDEIIKKKFLV